MHSFPVPRCGNSKRRCFAIVEGGTREENMIKVLKPDVRFVGEEYKGKPHTGHDIKGTQIIYNKRSHNYGSTQLRDKIFAQENEKRKD